MKTRTIRKKSPPKAPTKRRPKKQLPPLELAVALFPLEESDWSRNFAALFESTDLRLVGCKMGFITVQQSRTIYHAIVDKPFYPEIEKFVVNRVWLFVAVEGRGARSTVFRKTWYVKSDEEKAFARATGRDIDDILFRNIKAPRDLSASPLWIETFFAPGELITVPAGPLAL